MDVKMAKYEMMVILMPDMGESKTAEELQEVRELITSVGGEIFDEDLWGNRKLAYSMKKQDNGYYAVLNFTLDTSKVHELEKSLILNPQVIRQLVIRISDAYTLKKLSEYEEEWAKQDLESKEKDDAEQTRKEELKKPVRKVEKPLKKEEKVEEVKEEKPKKEVKKVKEEKEEVVVEEEKPKKESKTKKEEETDSKTKLDEFDAKLRSLINDPDITL